MAGCDGPNGSRWDGERCVSGSQTSCDEINQTTCFYAAYQDGVAGGESESYYLSGHFLDDGRFEVGGLIDAVGNAIEIAKSGLFSSTGLQAGDRISHLNGKKIKQKAFMAFTPKSPFRSARVCRDSNGSIELILRKTRR